jgi:hypothetical protein
MTELRDDDALGRALRDVSTISDMVMSIHSELERFTLESTLHRQRVEALLQKRVEQGQIVSMVAVLALVAVAAWGLRSIW